MQRLNNIVLSLDEDESELRTKCANALRIKAEDVKYLKIIKKSIDARKRNNIKFVYSVDVDTKEFFAKPKDYRQVTKRERVVVVGFGPCGLFAGLMLARAGVKPIIFERGDCVDIRAKKVNDFVNGGKLDVNSNVQFGEGGAGTFSDGKLNTQVNSPYIRQVLSDFVSFGAPEEISYVAKPHIGSDKLGAVIKNIREEIQRLGGQIRFNSLFSGISKKNGKIRSVFINDNEVECDKVVLAIGHSARDTFEVLNQSGVMIEQKPFAVGFRVEQLQEIVNRNQYGDSFNHKKLGSADYKLVSHASDRGVFSFCMCPGGIVMPSTSVENCVVTNGMSNFARDEKNANSAIVCQVLTSDFGSSSPLAGVEFQKTLERKAFDLGGGDYVAPIQLAEDFVKDRKSTKLNGVFPSYKRGYRFAELKEIFPSSIAVALKKGLIDMENKFSGIASSGAVLTGVESRTSSPIRIVRDENFESVNVQGLYPCGEGCGYAGGIMSAAIDGIKIAEKIIEKLL